MGKGAGQCDARSAMSLFDASEPPEAEQHREVNKAAARAEQAAHELSQPVNLKRLGQLPYSLIVDMDDTLISNQLLFDRASTALLDVYGDFDPQHRSAEDLRALHSTIDNANIEYFGYTPRRWFYSAFQVAHKVCGRKLTAGERLRIKHAAKIAMGTGEMLPGASAALGICRQAEVKMLLKTKGDRSKQEEKLVAHSMRHVFDEQIVIVDRKDSDSFRDVVRSHGLNTPVSIGDSLRSDIAPALANGYRAILIDKTTAGVSDWGYEQDDQARKEVVSVPSFAEAVLLLVTEKQPRV